MRGVTPTPRPPKPGVAGSSPAAPVRSGSRARPTVDPALVDLLVCPETGQRLALAVNTLAREDGDVAYPILDGVPALFPEDGVSAADPHPNRDFHVESGFDTDKLTRLAAIERTHFWFVGRRKLVDRLVARHAATRDQLVIDVGCGTGSITALLARRGHRVVGVDTDVEGLAAAARAREDAWFVRADGARLPFRRDTFDGATVMDVLEHVDDDAAFLADVVRVVKRRGWVLVTVPAMPWLWSHADEVAGHRRRYARGRLHHIINGSGLKVEALSHYQALLFPLVATTRLLGRAAQDMREREQRPPPVANTVLAAITNLELALGERVRWPWGSSLVAFCRKA